MLTNREIGVVQLLVAFLLLSISSAQNCSSSLEVSTSDNYCRYSIKYLYQVSCQTPLFINCTVTSVSSSSTLAAHPLNLSLSDMQQCSSYCCQNNQSFAFCSISKTTQQQSTLIIVVVVVTVIILLGLLGSCLYKCHQQLYFCCKRIFCPKKKSVANSHQFQHNVTFENFAGNESNQWTQSAKLAAVEDCSVCLCAYPNLELNCGHTFHKQCILQCLKRKYECILCRSKDLFAFKIYCHHCYQSYKVIGEHQFYELSKCQLIACNNCYHKESCKNQQ